MKKLFSIPMMSCIVGSSALAQSAFTAKDYLNINNIDAEVLVHGDMWYDPVSSGAHCNVPSGSGKNIASAGALWMSGYDAGSNLHIAAQISRQMGVDYWPGPLDASGALNYATSQNWAKIWRVSRADIETFKTMSAAGTATPANTASAIWQWPARGNHYAFGNGGAALTITDDMAPFKDLNGDGIYEPDQGEYPDVPGDLNLWWVFSDNGPTHASTNGTPLKVEVHALAFAFRRWDIFDNIAYFQYDVINKSGNNYQNFRIGQYADMDLGTSNNDYIGCDSVRSMGIIYNATPTDDVYGTNMPMAGIMMRGSSTSIGIGMNSFMYFNNDASVTGNPTSPAEYDDYLRSKFRDGAHLVNDFTSSGTASSGHGIGPSANFVFPGIPANHTQWSECAAGNAPGDRRFIQSSGDLQFDAGSKISVTIMLVTTDLRSNNACSASLDFSSIDSVADQALSGFDTHYNGVPTAVGNPPAIGALNIYPNPANSILFLEHKGKQINTKAVTVYNVMGQAMNTPITTSGQTASIDISQLPAGVYEVIYNTDVVATGKFVKE